MEPSSRDRLDLALHASNEGVWDWYVGDEGVYYSERALEFLGYDAKSAPNIITCPGEFFHPDDVEMFESSFESSLAVGGEDILAVDTRYKHPDASWRWLRIRGVVVRNYAGKAIRLVGSMIDISKRKNAEAALEEERYRLRQLVESIPINIYYKDKKSRFVLSNSSTAEKMGLQSVDELLGKSDHDFFDAAHADIARANELEIMRSRKAQLNIIRCETWEGKEDTWAETSKLPWLDKKGNVCGVFGITSDITQMVKIQRKLARVAEELHARNQSIEEEMHLAREIQQAMLPQCMEGSSLRSHNREIHYHCRYAPASDMAGDFFEIMPISQHRIGVFVCDVMGHGVRSSLVVSMLRGLMEKERDSATSPEWFLYGINDGLVSIFERAGMTLFATAVYCVINLKKGTLSYSCAGHPAPMVIHRGQCQQLPVADGQPNPALGLIPQAPFSSQTVSLDEVDRMLLFTDGLHEIENEDGQAFEMEKIQSVLEASHNQDLDTCLDSLLEQAREYAVRGEFEDDVCLFAMDVSHVPE